MAAHAGAKGLLDCSGIRGHVFFFFSKDGIECSG